MLPEDKNAIIGTFLNVPRETFPSYVAPAPMTTQRQGKAA